MAEWRKCNLIRTLDELRNQLLAAGADDLRLFAAEIRNDHPLWEGNQRDGNFGFALSEAIDDFANWQEAAGVE